MTQCELRLPRRKLRSRGFIAGAAALAVAACVSLSTPRSRGGADVPAVSVGLQPGSRQIVRILLASSGDTGTISATGAWGIFEGAMESPRISFSANEALGRRLYLDCNPAGRCTNVGVDPAGPVTSGDQGLIVRPLSGDAFVTFRGKRYRGALVIVPTDSGRSIVNTLPMDSYLRGVVPLEIGSRTAAEFAAVQAQAVAARTYAYKHLTPSRAFDMYATVQDQVYGGVDVEKPQSDSAIATTADVVVLYNGRPISTPYHSTCGGSTAAVTEVWYNQSDEPYLRPVSDRVPGTESYYCDASPRFRWTQNYDAAGLRMVMEKYLSSYSNAPRSGLGKIIDISEQGRTPSGRVAALAVQTGSGRYTLRGNDIRFVLRDPKGAIMNSTYFTFTAQKDGGEVSGLSIAGRGYGHGIGMCQWGAIGRARAGQNYRTILETYYPGTTIGRIAG